MVDHLDGFQNLGENSVFKQAGPCGRRSIVDVICLWRQGTRVQNLVEAKIFYSIKRLSKRSVRVRGKLGIQRKLLVAFPRPNIPHPGNQAMNKFSFQ